jgi:hypothetical protein
MMPGPESPLRRAPRVMAHRAEGNFMHPSRFDHWTRALAANRSRRSAPWVPSPQPLWSNVTSPLLRTLRLTAVPASAALALTTRLVWRVWSAAATVARRQAIAVSPVPALVMPVRPRAPSVSRAPIAVRGSVRRPGHAPRFTIVKREATAVCRIPQPAHRV